LNDEPSGHQERLRKVQRLRQLDIVLSDDQPAVLLGLRAMLERQADRFRVIGQARSSEQLFQLLNGRPCDLVITDFSKPRDTFGSDGLSMLKALRELHPGLPVIVFTMLSSPILVRAMLREGVRGVVDKCVSAPGIVTAINDVLMGNIHLSREIRWSLGDGSEAAVDLLSTCERQVIAEIAKGKTVNVISQEIGRSNKTVSHHKRSAMRKLGCINDMQLFEYIQRCGVFGRERVKAMEQAEDRDYIEKVLAESRIEGT
jgi:two-component system capsular synthesis response regulator RcsB